ncbi:MAG: hypothetical protein NZU63_12865, partial [Gemmataceae bacterium]|nr:hypothetical protein [Gemmataceae bacterium]MDW8244180.1 hypothetical protein [Thermogemmata sp.]
YSDFNFDKYSDLNITVEPVLPLFNDGEGRFILLVENWLNSRYARKALPMEQFNRLYREDKIQVFSPAYNNYIERIKARLDEECKKAEESFGGVSGEELSRAYSDIKSFFVLLAEPSGSAQNGAR